MGRHAEVFMSLCQVCVVISTLLQTQRAKMAASAAWSLVLRPQLCAPIMRIGKMLCIIAWIKFLEFGHLIFPHCFFFLSKVQFYFVGHSFLGENKWRVAILKLKWCSKISFKLILSQNRIWKHDVIGCQQDMGLLTFSNGNLFHQSKGPIRRRFD